MNLRLIWAFWAGSRDCYARKRVPRNWPRLIAPAVQSPENAGNRVGQLSLRLDF